MAAPARPPSAAPAALGLRERKKIKTRLAIRRAACRLIAERGYEATTVEQIAEAAEVSPSTVFRYFPTKEDIVLTVVLTDGYDPMLETALRARPADEPPIESLRVLLHQTLGAMFTEAPEEMEQRSRLLAEVPAVRARMAESMSQAGRRLAPVIAERTGRDPADLQARVFTSAALSALQETAVYWAERGCRDDPAALLDRALDTLGRGLTL
ncbi:TetR/AcrR family transcriptional regulator [Streptomyces sp. PR69]|uniref:TetR/AcrR family transcriptional regulator n=1 Tax=Streptomyces sp. PR69 TaxID=2984950 RepID=UPI0022652357|nr:TetR family transcriptional regulator [Streptomyces sp. PR69]